MTARSKECNCTDCVHTGTRLVYLLVLRSHATMFLGRMVSLPFQASSSVHSVSRRSMPTTPNAASNTAACQSSLGGIHNSLTFTSMPVPCWNRHLAGSLPKLLVRHALQLNVDMCTWLVQCCRKHACTCVLGAMSIPVTQQVEWRLSNAAEVCTHGYCTTHVRMPQEASGDTPNCMDASD